MSDGKKLISLVCPVLNEELTIPIFYDRLQGILSSLCDRYDFEFVFTDNASLDRTFEILTDLARKDPRVRVFRFSKNFGYQGSIWTGYTKSRGAAAMQLDVDLQDPPELLPEFLRLWEAGNRVVYGVRKRRPEPWWLSAIRKIFYRMLNALSSEPIPPDAGDFRLIDRKVIEELKFLDPNFLYIRGAIAHMGFKQIGVDYERAERQHGESKFGLKQLFSLAVDGLLVHSTAPLRMATYFGLTVSFLTISGAIAYAIAKLTIGQDWPAGFATIIICTLLALGINSLFLGILGEYVGRLYRQRNSAQRVIIDESLDSSRE